MMQIPIKIKMPSHNPVRDSDLGLRSMRKSSNVDFGGLMFSFQSYETAFLCAGQGARDVLPRPPSPPARSTLIKYRPGDVQHPGCIPAAAGQGPSALRWNYHLQSKEYCTTQRRVDLWCSPGKACLAHDPGAVISFLCALCGLCVRSCGHPCLLTASKLTQRTPRPQRRQLSFFQSRQRRPAMFLGQGLSGPDPGAVISFLCALCGLCVRSCGSPLQAHAKAAKKATIFLPKPTLTLDYQRRNLTIFNYNQRCPYNVLFLQARGIAQFPSR